MRSAVVTGASRGIGLGIARRLAERGHALTINARDAERLESVAVDLREAGSPEVLVVAGDAASESDMQRVVDQHAGRFGALSALVLGAGVGSAGPIAEYPLSRWDRQFTVNTRSAFVLIRQALPLLRATAAAEPDRGAKIIALSSIGGVYAEPGLAAYGAAKAALRSLCQSVNVEESAAGISATAIAPGYVDTDMSAWIHEQVPPESMIAVGDIVALVDGLLQMSARAVVPEVVVTRAGTTGYGA
jgi:3-oxoacyl-[acyl-carrier protein] reductase